MENKTGKPAFAAGRYFKYALGEIILVVIGILIALQLNTCKENKEKSDLGYKYLTEMMQEVKNDVFMLDTHIRGLEESITNQESALNTKSIAVLPIDSILMIMDRQNLDLNISELTFNRMKNLGLVSLSSNDSLNSKINTYYNSDLVFFKRAMAFIFDNFDEYSHYLRYDQETIDFTSKDYEFPSIYSQSKEVLDSINRINRIEFITSKKGRNLILGDLDDKRYSLRVINRMQEQSVEFLKSIYDELKIQNPQMETLPLLPSEVDFKEIEVSTEQLKTYIGKYISKSKDTLNIILDGTSLFVKVKNFPNTEIFPYEEDKFFVKDFFTQIEFKRENGEITSFNGNRDRIINFKKID